VAYDDAAGYANQSYVSLATGTYNNVGPSIILQYKVGGITYPPYSSGATRVIYILPTGGNVTITGMDASQASSGHTIICVNMDATGNNVLIFPHLSGLSTAGNQFSNESLGSVSINSGGAARCTWLYPPGAANGFWQFA
jgi:hypothetical protein